MNECIGSTKEQFESEAASVKSIIYEIINAGNLDVALQLLEQYALLNPTDLEINEMKMLIDPEFIARSGDDIPDKYSTLKDIETIFVMNNIVFGRIGTRDSVFRKVKMMEDAWNYKPLIMTCFHNIDHRQARLWQQTSEEGKVSLSANIQIINVFEHFQKSYVEGLVNKAVYEKKDAGLKYVMIEENVYEVYEGNNLIRQEHYTGYLNSLRMISNYQDGIKINEFVYDDWGYLNCVKEYDSEDEDIYIIKYFTTTGNLCIEAFYNHMDLITTEPEELILYDDQGGIIKHCSNRSELAAICLSQIISQDKFSMLVVEDGLFSEVVTASDANKSNRAICEVFHSVHQTDPYNANSEPQIFYKHTCENLSSFDGIVLLTEEQKKDFCNQYGNEDNIFVIPHFYPYEITKVDFNKRDHKKAVIVARLDPLKQLDHSIFIFSLVVKEVPDARLEIYGRGQDEDVLYKYIQKLGLTNNVFLMGLTDDPISVMKTASLFMLTSLVEGYGITLIESISNGCPVFSYDIKYGPAEIVDEGKTGFLFHRFDNENFASKMIDYFNDIDMQKTMSENCYVDAPGFSSNHFPDKWYNMTTTLYNRRKRSDL